jgi:hypothetical protein
MTHSMLGRGLFAINADFLYKDSYHEVHEGHEVKNEK